MPEGGYAVYGVDAAGMDPNGMPSNEDGTLVDRGFAGCQGRPPSPTRRRARTRTASSRRTPRSSRCATGRAEAIANLARIERIPGAYGQWGFADSSTSARGFPSPARLSLDQGMIMAALGNALGGDVLRDAFSGGDFAPRGAARARASRSSTCSRAAARSPAPPATTA